MKFGRIRDFQDLMDTRYGAGSPKPKRFSGGIESLLHGYYGAAPKRSGCKDGRKQARVHAMSFDGDMKCLKQRRKKPAAGASVYPMSRSFSEGAVAPTMPPAGDVSGLPDADRARQEQLLDLFAPDAGQAPAEPAPPGTQPPLLAPAPPPVPPLPPSAVTPPPQPMPVLPTPPTPPPVMPPPPDPLAADPPTAKAASEDEFLADMQAILSGQKAYDPFNKTLTDRHGVGRPADARADPPAPPRGQPAPRIPAAGDGHDIFQRIAQSMEYAGAYDLGPIELENRFAEFDRNIEDQKPKTMPTNEAPVSTSPVPPEPMPVAPQAPEPPRPAEIGQDIRDVPVPTTFPEAPMPPAEQVFPDTGGREAPTVPPVPLGIASSDYAEPFYASGEHIRAGDGLYPHGLVVGQKPGLAFSYGDLVAMADLFKSPEQMMAASVAELSNVKGLLNADLAHYSPGGSAKPAPGSSEWEWATKKRYLRLAEDNYDHFAPNLLFPSEKFAASVGAHSDHKQEWEKYHKQALAEVAKLKPGLDPALTYNRWPLIVNAFGDHYLTDAFSAGHVINKAAIMGLFRANFYSGGKLTKDGEAFLETVAKLAWKGRLAQKFSALETAEPVFLWWNPNIDSPGMFARVLKGIANQEVDKVANLAVKCVHDKLNKEGLEVTNGLGATPWRLTGDGYLTEQTLKAMQAAVKQSVADILDPAARQPGFDPKPFLARTWAHVPQLTPKSTDYLRKDIPTFIHTSSVRLASAAADIIYGEADTLIKELVARNKLKPA